MAFLLAILSTLTGCNVRPGPANCWIDGGVEGEVCETDSDCAPCQVWSGPGSAHNQRLCAYRIADGCGATTGHCMTLKVPTSAMVEEFCGCQGGAVKGQGGTYWPGYSASPTNGKVPPC